MFGIFNKKSVKSDKEVTKLLIREVAPLIEAYLNGKKAYFLLDTGATTSMLDITQSDKYQFNVEEESDAVITGIGGQKMKSFGLSKTSFVLNSKLYDITFNGKDLSHVVSAINDSTGYKILGIIGSDVIYRNKWVIDFNKGTVWKH